MKRTKFLLALLIIPWLTVPFLGRNYFKKYLPASIFSAMFSTVLDMTGERRKWWRFYEGIGPFNSMNFFNLGPYMVASLWILRISKGKFSTYFIINAFTHLLYTLFAAKYMKRFKIGYLVKMKKPTYFVLLSLRGLVLYGFQWLIDWKGESAVRFKAHEND